METTDTTTTARPSRKTPEQQITALNKKLEQALTRKLRDDWTKEQRVKAQAGRDATAKRRAETRRKIELGGLVIVAGAHNLEEATLVGLLCWAMSSAMTNPQRLDEARQRGIEVMTEKKLKAR
jgi:hypothetical protein